MGAGEGEVWTEALMANEKNGDSVNFTCRKKARGKRRLFCALHYLFSWGCWFDILGSFLVVGTTFLAFHLWASSMNKVKDFLLRYWEVT